MIPKNDFSKVISPDMFTHVCYGPHKPSRIPKRVFVQDPNIKTGRRDQALIPNTPLSQM